MKDIGTLIYIGIILISVFGGLLGKKKKKPAAYNQQPQQKPRPASTQKTLEDIIREITTGTTQPSTYTPPTTTVGKKEITAAYSTLEDEDPENTLVMDDAPDHHVHGKGFDDAPTDMYARVEERFEVDDWRKAFIVSEILKRPEY